MNSDIGYSQNGDYHLKIAKALCYKGIGDKNKAIQIIEDRLFVEDYSPLPYDYLHLRVLKLETGEYYETTPTTDFFQYAILIRNSGALTKLD